MTGGLWRVTGDQVEAAAAAAAGNEDFDGGGGAAAAAGAAGEQMRGPHVALAVRWGWQLFTVLEQLVCGAVHSGEVRVAVSVQAEGARQRAGLCSR